jgi:ankyrin repeat protein
MYGDSIPSTDKVPPEPGATWLRGFVAAIVPLVTILVLLSTWWTAESRVPATAAQAAALFEAAQQGDVGRLEQAISGGMPIDSRESGSKMTPLMWAVRRNHRDAVNWLLARGADIEAQAGPYGSPLAMAAEIKDGQEMVRLLLNHGANVNACTGQGHSPLMRAAACGNTAAAELLIQAGADVNARDHWGNTPMILARDCGQHEVLKQLLRASGPP